MERWANLRVFQLWEIWLYVEHDSIISSIQKQSPNKQYSQDDVWEESRKVDNLQSVWKQYKNQVCTPSSSTRYGGRTYFPRGFDSFDDTDKNQEPSS